MDKQDNMVLRTVYLPKELDRELKTVAFRMELSKGELMRILVQDALQRRKSEGLVPADADHMVAITQESAVVRKPLPKRAAKPEAPAARSSSTKSAKADVRTSRLHTREAELEGA